MPEKSIKAWGFQPTISFDGIAMIFGIIAACVWLGRLQANMEALKAAQDMTMKQIEEHSRRIEDHGNRIVVIETKIEKKP